MAEHDDNNNNNGERSFERFLQSLREGLSQLGDVEVGQDGTVTINTSDEAILKTKAEHKVDKALNLVLEEFDQKEIPRGLVVTKAEKKSSEYAKRMYDEMETLISVLQQDPAGDSVEQPAAHTKRAAAVLAVLGPVPAILKGLQGLARVFSADVETDVVRFQAEARLVYHLENRGYTRPQVSETARERLNQLDTLLEKSWTGDDTAKVDEIKKWRDDLPVENFLRSYRVWELLRPITQEDAEGPDSARAGRPREGHLEVDVSADVFESKVTRAFFGESYKVHADVLVWYRHISATGDVSNYGSVYVTRRRGPLRWVGVKRRVDDTFSSNA